MSHLLAAGRRALQHPNDHSKPGAHPRRPPAQKSVSLRHRVSSTRPDGQNGEVGPIESPHPTSTGSSILNNRESSGETSNAEKWFENSNKNAMNNRQLPADNEPPFFFNQSSSDSLADTSNNPHVYRSFPAGLERFDSGGSSSDEYRSVIDDLTIQNKKLKKKLRRYERFHDRHLDSEKLFEVKFHGLSADKKRELEDTLKKFAMGLAESPTSGATAASSEPLGSSERSTARRLAGKSSASSTRLADSGYGSNTASGQVSKAHSTRVSSTANGSASETSRARDRNIHIHSYLHDIPEGLMPRHSTTMTEKTRKKMVVRRLEQIFCGRGAASSGHQQPIQQQEVSHTAARDDRSAMEARGQKAAAEGVREAHIMDEETEDPMDLHRSASGKEERSRTRGKGHERNPGLAEHDSAVSKSLIREQRPTRPLDLDPYRAQVPAENIEYIRHLGFTLPESNFESSPTDDEGWIYLNVLTNMAQLHTINVTPEFVKKAVAECSAKMELSSDGRKIRWRGGRRATEQSTSSSSGVSPDTSNVGENAVMDKDRKRDRPADEEWPKKSSSSGHIAKKLALSPTHANRLAYTPLIVRKYDDDDEMADVESSPSSLVAGEAAGESSAFAGNAAKNTPTASRKDDGPMIFYSKAKFCTDLSGDRSIVQGDNRTADYLSYTGSTLGVSSKSYSARGSSDEGDRPLLQTFSRMSVDGDQSSSGDQVEFVESSSPRRVSFAMPEETMEFEASGVGGVRPDDNLAIAVVRQYRPARSGPCTRRRRAHRLNNLLPAAERKEPVSESVVSARKITLPPSQLPPASYAFDDEDASGSEGSCDSDDDNNNNNNNANGAAQVWSRDDHPSLAAPAHSAHYLLSDESEGSSHDESPSGDDDDDDDQSLDFLATARAADPDAVRTKEREYDAEMADRLADDIPAGSSAATAGGGSGFTSPADGEATDQSSLEPQGSVSS